jgi:hypothetical protein
MIFKNILLSLTLISAINIHAMSDMNDQNLIAMEEINQFLQDVNEKVMGAAQEFFFEGMVEIHVKYHKEIEWLRKNYWQNHKDGDIRVNNLKNECLKMMMPKMEKFLDYILNEMPAVLKVPEMNAYWSQFKAQMIQQMPIMLEQSLKLSMLIESTAYAKLNGLLK